MIIEALPNLLEKLYDSDSLIYHSDTEMYYNKGFDKDLLIDIENHDFQLYNGTYEYKEDWESPKIYLVGRGRTCGKKIFKVEGFLPYTYFENDKGEYKTYLGERVTKVILKTQPKVVADLRKLRERIGSNIPYEADILFVRRFLCDTYDFFKPTEHIEPKVCIYDVETNFPANNNMISFSINGYDGYLYHCSKYQEPNRYSLILDAYTKLIEYDIVANWNVEFDIKKLQGDLAPFEIALEPMRMGYTLSKLEYIKKLSVDYNRFSVNIATNILDALVEYDFLKYEDGVLKKGSRELDNRLYFFMTPLDLIPLAKKMYGREIPGRWSLDNAGYRLCGCGKYPISTKYMKDLDEEELLIYNSIDTIVPEVIDNYLGAIPCHVILAWSLQSQIPEMELTAVVNDIALLRAYHKDGIVLPSRPPWKKIKKKSGEYSYKAAEPVARPGVYKKVVATDINSAYPSAVIAINASPETKDPNGVYTAPNNVKFNNGYSTFIEELKRLLNDRNDVKKKLIECEKGTPEWQVYKFIDFSLKTTIAAFSHGVFGWENSRMKDVEVADSITATARGIIDIVKDKLDVLGHPWIYAHTDSAYFCAPKEEIKRIVTILNDTIKYYCVSNNYSIIPLLDYKGFYKQAYIHSAARNVLIPEDGSIDNESTWEVTGCNFIRSETSEPLANIEIKLITMKLANMDEDEIFNKLREMVCNLKDIPSSELAIIKPLTKSIKKYGKIGKDGNRVGIPFHIKSLLRAGEDYGFKIKIGEKFNLIPIITEEYDGVRVRRRRKVFMAFPIDEELPGMYSLDWENYLRSNLWGKLGGMFDLKPKEFENIILTPYVKDILGIEYEN